MKGQKKTAVIIGIFLLLGIVSFGLFYSASRNYLRSICNAELEDYAIANAATTKVELENALQLIQTACESFSDMQADSSNNVQKKLQIIAHNSPFESMILSGKDGSGQSSTGAKVDSTQFINFKRTIHGESNITAMDTNEDGKLEIVVSAPILSKGKVQGALYGIYQIFDMSKMINSTSYDGYGYAVLIDTSGNIIVPDASPYCLNKKEENYWTFFEKVVFGKHYTYPTLLQDIKDGKSGLTMYSVGREQRELYYTPLGINDWYLLQMVTGNVINNYTRPMNRKVAALVFALGLSFLLIGIVINRSMEKSRKEKFLEAERFRALTENIPGGVAEVQVGEECILDFANDGFFKIMGYSKEEFFESPIRGRIFHILASEEAEEVTDHFYKQISRNNSVYLEYQIRPKNGDIRWISMAGKIIHEDQGISYLQALVTDVTLQKQAAAEIMETAKRDKMTHLYDKVSVAELAAREIGRTQLGGMDALLVLDIDDFKSVNDTYGHQVGDQVIIQIANTICETFRNTDLIGRIGGDEFMVLMLDVTDLAHVKKRVTTFLQNIANLELDGTKGALSCSVGGVVLAMRESHVFDDIFWQADQNLYQVKKNGKGRANIQLFQRTMEWKGGCHYVDGR